MLSIILPAYNEQDLIIHTLREIEQFLIDGSRRGEVIVVDDGSNDATAEKVEAWISNYHGNTDYCLLKNEENRGKGFSVRRGMQKAAGENHLFMDADLPFDLRAINRIIENLNGDFDVAIGNRNDPGSKLTSITVLRKIAGRVFILLVQIVVQENISDTQCGLKAFTKEASHIIFSRGTIDGFGFDAELLRIAQKHNMRIARVPVVMLENRKQSRVRLLQDSLKMFGNIFTIMINDMTGKYN